MIYSFLMSLAVDLCLFLNKADLWTELSHSLLQGYNSVAPYLFLIHYQWLLFNDLQQSSHWILPKWHKRDIKGCPSPFHTRAHINLSHFPLSLSQFAAGAPSCLFRCCHTQTQAHRHISVVKPDTASAVDSCTPVSVLLPCEGITMHNHQRVPY